MTGRFLVVELESGLPAYRINGLFAAIKQHPGVRLVCDLEAISAQTLSTILLKPEPVVFEVPERVWQAELLL